MSNSVFEQINKLMKNSGSNGPEFSTFLTAEKLIENNIFMSKHNPQIDIDGDEVYIYNNLNTGYVCVTIFTDCVELYYRDNKGREYEKKYGSIYDSELTMELKKIYR